MSASEEAEKYLSRLSALTIEWIKRGEQSDSLVSRWASSSQLRDNVTLDLSEEAQSEDALFDNMRSILDNSINPYTGRFLDKLYSAPRPIGLAAENLLSTLNANGHVMSASPMLCLAEETCVAGLAKLCGWNAEEADGLTMPGGSSSNTLAMQTALQNRFPAFRKQGMLGIMKDLMREGTEINACRPLLFTSAQSHYSLDKAAMGCGLGLESVVKVPCDAQGRMDVAALERLIIAAKDGDAAPPERRGVPFFVNATSGSTVLGSFDNLQAISEVCQRYRLWLHVDGSWGGPVLFSEKWAKLMSGIDKCDSLAINPHKVLNAPLQCSFAVFKRGSSLEANSLDAGYLFHTDSQVGIESTSRSRHLARRENPGALAYGCGRRGDALKLYLLWNRYGRRGLGEHVDRGFELAQRVADLTSSEKYKHTLESGPRPDPLFLQVCFRPTTSLEEFRRLRKDEQIEALSKCTRHVHATLRQRRRFAVDFAPLPGEIGEFIRLVVHPQTSFTDLADLVQDIAIIGAEYFRTTFG
ncbi:PLP-dependent transferase [Ceraceosorus guamensis]|uniref:PLP-dependent transferase n=1 Tax=Ceraceosorus guamensis TaxID=1522189 RepID=A0A316VXW4_9BASI|nr:PLP-dependent transferase [Ceraceosorus guamensis]PWN41748.1 PLP-dependent transferase [Ceraceosorus guamensis]